MHIDAETIERATLDAVAPAEIGHIPDWLLPFDSSTVVRAISAVPLRHSHLNCDAIALIETSYAERNLTAQFRIADVEGLANVHTHLRSCGYQPRQPTLTMIKCALRSQEVVPCWSPHLSDKASPEWKSVYLARDFDPIDGANRVKALIRSQCATYAWIEDERVSVAAATAAISHGWMSLHGLRTIKRMQSRGCATALIHVLCNHAKSRNTQRCFLQVEESNFSAISLYRNLGFQIAWRYHYWRKPI